MSNIIQSPFGRQITRSQSHATYENDQFAFAKPKFWSKSEDERLLEAVADGLSFRHIAASVGRSRNSCIGRWFRIRTAAGEQAK